jgi:SAM-dependent methyltransferase
MPTIEENQTCWNTTYEWTCAGDEWSGPWGGTAQQWFSVLLPRLHRFLPAGTLLEIAPGFGRWTAFLAPYCRKLIGVDLAQKCVRACEERFRDQPQMAFHMNDGSSLSMIGNSCVDLAFSFDSLVHADEFAIYGYLKELYRTLKPGGRAFIHHSNLGEYVTLDGIPLVAMKELFHEHGRDRAMTAEKFRIRSVAEGLEVPSQELLAWGNAECLIDCITLLVKPPPHTAQTKVVRNVEFMQEAAFSTRLAVLYGEETQSGRPPAVSGSSGGSVSEGG